MRRNLKLISAALLFPMAVSAQTDKIQGTIVSETDGQPLIGVVVRVKGTASGTVTDIDGHYQLKVNPKDVVEFSCIGYKTVTQKGKTGTFDFKMEEDTNMLDEVVAIGYGSMKKSDLTGSVAVVKAEDLKKTPAASVDQAIQGRVAGVTVNANSGQPGAGAVVRIRGIGTVNDSAPIYVVDGNITSDISFLSPNDIESTEVLKDASSTAIYGARGANGVILITTKSGEKGHGKVSFDMYYGWQNRWKKLDLMNKDEFVQTYLKLAAPKSERNYYEKKGFNEWLQKYKLGNDAYYAVAKTKTYQDGFDYSAVNTDWQDEVFNSNAPIQNYHVSFDGGSDKSNYSFSASYFDQEGTIIGSSYNRLTLRANTSFQVKKWLKIGENLSFVTSQARNAMNQNASPGASVISAALAMAPWDVPYYPAGTYNRKHEDMSGKVGVPSNFKNVTNPFSMVYYSHPHNVVNRWFGNMYLEFTPIKGLNYRTNFSYDQVNEKNRTFTDAHTVNSYDDSKGKNFLTRGLVQYTTFTWENIINYQFDLGKIHHFNAMVGQTTEEYNYYSIGGSGSSILNPSEKNWYLSQTTDDNTNPIADGVARTRRLSFLARLNYNLMDRYLITINFRADGSNKFPENTWGYFPSTAFAWKVSEEPFMKRFKKLDYLKLRLGWGQIGNDKINNDAFNQTIFTSQNVFVGYPFGVNQTVGTGATILTYVNQGGKWERTETWNAGVDAAWRNGLLSANVDFFVRNTKDMLLSVKGPAWSGNRFDAQSNVGTVRNVGVEISLGHSNHIGKVNYSVNGNVSFIKNKLTSLNGGQIVYGDRVISDEGLPLFEFWGYKYLGVYKSKEEADAALPGYARDGEVNPYGAGDAIYADLDGDGKISETGDRTKLGNNFPKVTYGLNLSADWKGLDLQLFFQGVAGNKIYNAVRERTESNGLTSQLSTKMCDVWTEDNPDGTIPNPKGANNMLNSSRFLESGSYFRLKNIQLGYTLPKKLLNGWGISNLRVYAQASNLFTITNYSGYDPEVGSGVDYGNYPQSRTYMFGCNFTF